MINAIYISNLRTQKIKLFHKIRHNHIVYIVRSAKIKMKNNSEKEQKKMKITTAEIISSSE